ncbi:MAG: restriction endonuclease [Candidatus Absconditabacteria bacterium]|nr:restriction endonuclease [Candidatus Absconditabacteria bacterium]MDD3868351.1 restriction endonuclease [Candidatus Absconditabacteria bacterium]MDD4714426.1 restriction endonuclease [Candidatus Absconditabacteria bacterium]
MKMFLVYGFLSLIFITIVVISLSLFKIKRENIKKRIEKINKKQEINIENTSRRRFEKQIAEVLKQKGYKIYLGSGFKDGGIDVRGKKENKIVLVQCKHWRGSWRVKTGEVREFFGAMALYKKQYKYENILGIFITTGKSSRKAKKEAERLGIELRDEENYIEKILQFT